MAKMWPLIKSCWPAIALTAIAAALISLTLAGLGQRPDLAMRTIPLADGSELVTWVMPAGYSSDAGLRPGDRVRSIPLPSDSPDLARFELMRGNHASSVVSVTYPWSDTTNFLLIILGVEFLAAGLLIFTKASDRSIAHLLLLVLGAWAIALISTPTLAVNGQPWANYLNWISIKLAVAAFAYFFSTIPMRRWRGIVRPLLWALPPLVAWYTYAVLFDPPMYSAIWPFDFGYMAFCLGIGVLALAWPFLTRAPKEQRRLWPIAVCAGLSTLAFVGSSLVPYMLLGRYIIAPEFSILSWALLPVGFVLAILSYRIFGVDLGPWALLRTVFDSITDAIFVVRSDGYLANASPSGLGMLGLTRIGDAKAPFEELLRLTRASVERGNGGSVLERVLAGEIVRDQGERVTLQDGTVVHTSVAGTPICDERGAVALAVLVYRNITERKQAEEALRKAHDELETRVQARTVELAQTVVDLRETTVRLDEGQRKLQELNRRLLMAEEEERRRLSADLHDEPVQRLMLLMRQIEACAGVAGNPGAVCLGLASEAMTTLRRICSDFHPPLLEDLGLEPALEWLVQSVAKSSNIAIKLQVDPDALDGRLSQDVEIVLFRVAQEALNNAIRHSGASSVEAHLSRHARSLMLSIKDDGCGFAQPESLGELSVDGHMGIIGMRERLRMIGGKLDIYTAPGEGTEIVAVAEIKGGKAKR